MKIARWCVVWLAGVCMPVFGATVWHVKPGGDEGAAGTAWESALATVTNALRRAAADDAIWVAAGTYYPTDDGVRTKSIVLKPGVAVYGGFAGSETDLGERDWTNHVTVLSGDIGTPGELTDNSYHVVMGATGARLDGFVVRDGYADGATSNRLGGGLYAYNAHMTTANCVFTNNAAIGAGSGIAAGGGAYWDQAASVVATSIWENCVFAGNLVSNSTTMSYGGGLYAWFWTTTVFVVSNCTFAGNAGRGVYAGGAGLTLHDRTMVEWEPGAGPLIVDTRFEGNQAFGSYCHGAGARVQSMRPPVTFSNCVFASNRFWGGDNSFGGGGLYLVIPVTGHGVRMTDCLFVSNECSYVGGAVSFNTSGGTNSVWRNCLFVGNMATNHGGAIAGAVDGTFVDCTFVSNRAFFYQGGAVRVQSAGAVAEDRFVNGVFRFNQSGGLGGGMSAEAPVRLEDCVFEGNTGNGPGAAALNWVAAGGSVSRTLFVSNSALGSSSYGGAVQLGVAARARFEACVFLTNSIGWYGGALRAPAGSSLELEGCYFGGNRAVGYYGGAALIESTNTRIRQCVFVENSASNAAGYGGALCFRSLSTFTNVVENSVFRDNVGRYGGAIATYNAHVMVSNCTLFANRAFQAAAGGGLYHLSASYTCRVENAILWSNTAAGAAHEIYQPAGGGVHARYSCVQGGYAGDGNVAAEPLFADETYLHLKARSGHWVGGYFTGGSWGAAAASSPLIDAGDPDSAWGLEPAPNGGRINMGAYGNTAAASKSGKPSGTVLLIR